MPNLAEKRAIEAHKKREIENYVNGLQQNQMTVADTSHASPNSAEEGVPNPYEHNPHLQKYRAESAVVNTKTEDPYEAIIQAANNAGYQPPQFAQDFDAYVAPRVSAVGEAVTKALPSSFKHQAGSALQWFGDGAGEDYKIGDSYTLHKLSELYKPWALEKGKELAAEGAAEVQASAQKYPKGSPGHYPFEIALATGNMIPAVAASIATKNPNSGLNLMAIQAGATKYEQSMREGRTHDESSMDGFVFGLSEKLTEFVPMGIITKPLGEGAGFVWRAAQAGVAEAIQEPVNQIIQNLYDVGVLDKEMTAKEVFSELAEASKVGGGVGVLLSALSYAFLPRTAKLRGDTSTALDVIPGEGVGLQGQAPTVAPSATGEHIDMRRREFLRKARDMAQAAATVRPTDLLPDLAPEAAVSAPVQAGLPATLVRFDYANPPLWSAYNFDVSGWKDQYPGETTGFENTIDVEFDPKDGIVTVYDASYSGTPDIGGEVVGEAHISELIPDYVESQEVSQIDVDKAIMAYVKDNFSTNSVGDELRPVFTNVERDFDNTGDDGGPMNYGDIENYDYMNRPYDRAFEILGTDGFGFRKEPISQSRPGPLIQNNIGQIQNLRDQNDPDRAPGTKIRQEFDKEQKILEERERRRQPIQNNVELVQELRDQEDNTNKRKREAMRAFDEKQQEIEEIARTKELTDKIPGLNELEQQLKSARDRLKSLEAGIPPEGFEDDYSAEEIAEDIEIEKNHIEATEEEIAIKKAEPLEGEVTVIEEDTPTLDAVAVGRGRNKRDKGYAGPEGVDTVFDSAKHFLKINNKKIKGLSRYEIIQKARALKSYERLKQTDSDEVVAFKRYQNFLSTRIRNANDVLHPTQLQKRKVRLAKKLLVELRKDHSLSVDPDFVEMVKQVRTNSSSKLELISSGGRTGKRKSNWERRQRERNQLTEEGASPAGQAELEGFGLDRSKGRKKNTYAWHRVFKGFVEGKAKFQFDHIESLEDDGPHESKNIQQLTYDQHQIKSKLEREGRLEEAKALFSSQLTPTINEEDLSPGTRELLAENFPDLKALLDTETAAVSTEPETTNAYQDPEAKVIDEKKTAGKRKYVFSGKEHLPGIDYKRIIKKLNLRGRDTAEVHVEFVYVPNLDARFTFIIADEFIAGSKGKFGMAKERLERGNYRIVINLARFDGAGVTEVIGEQATRLGISPEELMEKIGKEKLQEYAIRSVLQHEITHVNHFAWERAILDRTGTNFSEKELGKFRRELYKAYRKEMIDFMRKDENAFLRLGLSALSIEGKSVIIESNEEAIEFLDMLTRDAAKPAATSSERLEASKRVWNMFSELLAYQSDSMNTETWVTKFKRVVKMILAKVGINVGKNDLNDLVDDLYSTGAVRENLTATKILRGEEAVLSEEEKLTARAREIKAKMEAPRGESAIVNPDKFKYANEILRNNNVSEDVIKDITKTLSTEERIVPVSDLMIPLESVFSLKYPAKDLQQRLKHLAKTNLEEYLNLVSFTETAERLYNLDIEEYTGREDINTGNAIHDLEEQIVGILGPVEIEEDAGPEYSDEDTWLNAWAEPKKKGLPKKRTIEEAFGDVVNNQTGVNPDNEQQYNETGADYTSPSSQEQTAEDDAAQQEYTGSDETSRPKARERTTLRSLWGFLYSQAAQTVRRHSGASKTAGVVADTVLRAPHHKLREKETKSGRDYVQKKSMALGEFRFEIQRHIDALTNRGGVISRKVNQQLTDFFSRGIIPDTGSVAAAAEGLKTAVEKIYAWSDKTGKKHTEDFSLRPLDGGVFPRVFDVDKVASPEGRKTLMDLLNSIGIVDDAANNKYDATDAYNIILSSGGFVSGDFTIKARLDGEGSIKSQQELFEKIEREISREQLGDLLLNDYQAIVPRFIDKAVEKTVYAELFGHRNENLNKLKRDIRKEVAEHNRKNAGTTLINVEDVIKDVDELMDIINHRYKVNTIPTRGRKVLQSAMNATTMASLTLVSLASMPEFLTATALGTKNPAKFATNILGASTFAVLRGLNGMHKLLTGKAMKGYFNPKTRMGKRAAMLRQLGLYDLANLGEAAAQRYVGPSFIKAGVGSTGNSFPIKALYRLYGLGNLEKGRFRARQVRAMLNMDVYFEVTALTTMTQMQQLMALTNLNQNIVADAKALSKAKRGKGFKLDSTVAQTKSNLKSLGLSNGEINELVRWYDAGHRQIHDVPPEFRLDLAGPAHRFVQSVVTLPSEGSLPKVFRDPRFAPFLLFKSFITTFGNTFINTIAQRVRFAEGKGVSKKYQQSKQIAGMFGTAAAMYGAVQFAQAIAYLIKHGDDENPWEEKTPDWAKFIQDFERTGLMGPLGSVAVQIGTPNYWSWQGKDPYDDMLDYIIGPMGKQFRNIGKAGADVAQGKELDLEGRLARAIPLTKSKPIREALGVDPYYTKDKKGKLIRKRTLERREEKKAATKEAKRQELLDSITNDAAKRIKLSKEQIVDMDRRELDKHMRTKLGFNPDGRKSKASMINQYLKSQGADQSSFLKSEESESYRRKHEALQKVRESAKERYKGMTTDERRKEYLSTNSMSKKEFDEYVEVEFGILLDGRKSRDDMNKQFHEVTKGWLKN